MIRISIAKAREDLDALFDRVNKKGEPVLVTRRGGKAVAVFPADDLPWLEEWLEERDKAEILEAKREAEAQGYIPYTKVREELGFK